MTDMKENQRLKILCYYIFNGWMIGSSRLELAGLENQALWAQNFVTQPVFIDKGSILQELTYICNTVIINLTKLVFSA